MRINLKKGFTLIELIIVIAIIGILASIVLTQLSQARIRGSDAAVKSNLDNIRSQIALYFSNNADSYGSWNSGSQGNCPTSSTPGTGMFSDSNILNAITAAINAGGNGSSCVTTGSAYAVAVGMKTSGQSWCIDSTGKSKQYASAPASAIASAACL